ncbi:MAG: DUF1828 domain-containing protein [Chloroflexi bacterium]|nr:DUF1828 domain-containing protein [Chloroflexota bacterium]
MADQSCSELANAYVRSLGDRFETVSNAHFCVIVTPFMRADGDYFEIFLEKGISGTPRLTDSGETIEYLYQNGLALSRKTLSDIRRIATQYHSDLQVNELSVDLADVSSGPTAVHGLVQAMINVGRLVEKRRPHTRLHFDAEVETLIIRSGVQYDTDYQVQGAREPTQIKFHVNSGRNLLIQPLTQTNESAARAIAERWSYRFNNILEKTTVWHPYVVLDDRSNRQDVWTEYARRPFEGVVTDLISWSHQDQLSEVLLASEAE